MDAIAFSKRDNVATAIKDLKKGQTVTVMLGEEKIVVELLEDVPFGHKFALVDIPQSAQIFKYGEPIGIATRDIRKGEYVHVHNVAGQRGVRGHRS
ncbi:MAG: UxaA family hydrolase [Thermotoga caldifontis]|uniref:UxaA family hydrolase n=1 Tax=Thermotoga caldifontis TaxID=1508419 RepID=UPI003C7ABEDA